MVHSIDQLETLLSLYRTAFLIRHVELEIAREYSKGEMRCPVHLSVGQEITSAVFSIFQTNRDYAVSSHRAHAHYLAKGGNLNAMISEIFGKVTGCSKGRGGSMHLSDPSVRFMGSSAIVGNSIPVGVGIGYGIKLRQEAAKSIIFFGDGATEEGVYYESLNFSIIHRLPTVFICENNYYSVYSSLGDRQPRDLMPYQLALSMGMNAFHVRFGDLNGTFQAFEMAMSPTLQEPVFLQIDTYRWLEHCGPNSDDDLGYRPYQELESHLKFDVINEIADRIISINSKLRGSIFLIEEEAKIKVSNAFEYARKSSFPNKDNCIGDFYAF